MIHFHLCAGLDIHSHASNLHHVWQFLFSSFSFFFFPPPPFSPRSMSTRTTWLSLLVESARADNGSARRLIQTTLHCLMPGSECKPSWKKVGCVCVCVCVYVYVYYLIKLGSKMRKRIVDRKTGKVADLIKCPRLPVSTDQHHQKMCKQQT